MMSILDFTISWFTFTNSSWISGQSLFFLAFRIFAIPSRIESHLRSFSDRTTLTSSSESVSAKNYILKHCCNPWARSNMTYRKNFTYHCQTLRKLIRISDQIVSQLVVDAKRHRYHCLDRHRWSFQRPRILTLLSNLSYFEPAARWVGKCLNLVAVK